MPVVRGKIIGWQPIMCLVVAAVLSGCGLTVQQKAALDQFSTATRELSMAAQTELQKSRQDVIEMNRLRLELGDSTADVTNLDSFLTLTRTTERLIALQALEDYGGLLTKLVGTASQEALLDAGKTFVGNLRQMKGVPLTESEAEGIGKAVAAVGGLFVEHKRASALRRVVETAHAPVLAVIDLVKRDFDPAADFWNAGYRQTALDLKGHAVAISSSAPENDLASKQSIQRAKTMAAENMDRFQRVSNEISALSITLAEAQRNLRLVLNPSELNVQSIDQLTTQVREFRTIYGLLRNEVPH